MSPGECRVSVTHGVTPRLVAVAGALELVGAPEAPELVPADLIED